MRKQILSLSLVVALVGGGVASSAFAQPKQVPVKKGCTKGKGKKKGCKKAPPAPAATCSSYTPGEKGSGKPTVVLTDTATEQQPVIQKVTLPESLADADLIGSGVLPPGSDAFNVQVDTANPDAGLHILFEFPTRRDYDLELFWSDGSYAARSHDFNPVYSDAGIHENGGHAGQATDASEHIVGVRTADCGGYTVETVNWLGEGGELEVKLWLGDVVNEAQPPGAESPGE